MPGSANKNVLQTGLGHGNCVNLAGKGLDQIGYETVSLSFFDPKLSPDDARVDVKAGTNTVCQVLGIVRLKDDHIAADFRFQIGRRAQSDEPPIIQNCQSVATLGLFHQMSSHQDRDPLLVEKNSKVLPHVAAGARIQSGCRFIEQKDARTVEQSLGQLEAALHATGKGFSQVFGAIAQTDAL